MDQLEKLVDDVESKGEIVEEALPTDIQATVVKTAKKTKEVSKVPNKLFSMEDFVFPNVSLFVGKPKRGKSYTMRYLIQYFTIAEPIFKFIKVFTGSYFNGDYDYLPDKAINKGYNADDLRAYHNKLIAMREKVGQDAMPQNCIVFDDILGQLSNDQVFQQVISTFRHTNTTIFLATQYINSKASSTNIKEYANYCFLYKTQAKKTIEVYHDWFGSELFDSIDDFKAHFKKQTKEPFTACLYIESNETLDNNFLRFRSPETYVNYKIDF
jgi:hypothetical protein